MAQPPVPSDVNETFLREVDENYRRDRVTDFFRDNKRALIAAVVLFLVVSGGLIWWEEHRRQQSGEEVEVLAETFRAIGEGKTAGAPAQLSKVADSSSDGIRASALFTEAALALEKGDSAKASKIYGDIHADSGMPQAYRDAALIRQITAEFDKLKPQDIVSRLAPLTKPGNPWFGSAAELTGAALIKQGKKAEAGKLFAQVANDKTAPETLRARSVQIAGSLGVDASAALTAEAR